MLAISIFFFFNDTATTEIYTLSLHDALPICVKSRVTGMEATGLSSTRMGRQKPSRARTSSTAPPSRDRKSTRLNSSHSQISYAVFCLKKKKTITIIDTHHNLSSHTISHLANT